MSRADIADRPNRKMRRLSTRARSVNTILIIIIFILVVVAAVITLNTINSNASENIAGSYSVETAEKFFSYISQDLILVQKAAKSMALTEWFAQEDDPDKKLAAYHEMMDYIGLLQNTILYYGIEGSKNQYFTEAGISPEQLVPFDKDRPLDPTVPDDNWYFECFNADTEYVLNIDIDIFTHTWQLWVNHKVIYNGDVVGVFCSGLQIESILSEMFAKYDNKNVRGYVIDKDGDIIMDSTLTDVYGINNIRNELSDPTFDTSINEYFGDISGHFDRQSPSKVIKLRNETYNYAAIAPIYGSDWSIVILVNSSLFSGFTDIASVLPLPLILLLALILYIIGQGALNNRLIFKPLNSLTQSVSEAGGQDEVIFGIDRDDEIGKLARTIRDASLEEHRLVQDVRAAAAKLDAVIANYAGVIWSVEADDTITLFNGLYLKEIGVTPDFIEGKSLELALRKNRHLDIIENVHKTFSEGSQDWISDIDGKMFHARTALIKDENGIGIGVVGSIDDVTETSRLQKELEAALEKANTAVLALESAQHTVASMFDANPHINILFNEKFEIVDFNPSAMAFMGFDTEEEMIAGFAKRLADSIPEALTTGRKTRPVVEWFITAVKEGKVEFETEFFLRGSLRSVNIELKKIPYEDSFAIVAYMLDMTEVHQREMELRRRDQQLSEAVEEAKAANQAKSMFLSTMSHEIRTPMNAILGITEIQLQNEENSPSIKEALKKIYASGDMLLGIINDILDLSKIESGKLELIIEKYEAASMISDTAQLNMMRIGSKPIEFELNINENIPSVLLGDELRVKQILNNVLSNAFKYTSSGTVKLSITAEHGISSDDDGVTLVVSVADTGQGMTKEQVGKIFDEFSRFNMEANRTTEGTGLGMSITRNLTQLMNGEIIVESEPGVGTTFVLRLPQRKVGSAVLGKEMANNLQQFRSRSRAQMKRVQITREPMPYGSVLIVDDVETNIYVAKGLLTPYGLNVDSVDSGFAAIERIKKGNTYDVVFMDHMMPQMDGIEATRIIRDMGYTSSIVALTANAVLGQADLFLENGFDDFISKPIDVRQLNNVLNKLIRDKHPPEVVEAARRQTDSSKVTTDDEAQKPSIDPRFAEVFVRDAKKSIEALETTLKKELFDDDDMRTYIIHTHGMKSALANIGEAELSTKALELEHAGRNKITEIITADTPAFLAALRALTEQLTPKAENEDVSASDEDRQFLSEKLHELKEASETFSKKTARHIVTQIREKAWPRPINEALEAIAESLLHSDFDEVMEIIDKLLLK